MHETSEKRLNNKYANVLSALFKKKKMGENAAKFDPKYYFFFTVGGGDLSSSAVAPPAVSLEEPTPADA